MKKTTLTGVLLLVCAAAPRPASAHCHDMKSFLLSECLAPVRKFVDGWNHNDAAMMASAWAPNDPLVDYRDPFGNWRQGVSAIKDLFEKTAPYSELMPTRKGYTIDLSRTPDDKSYTTLRGRHPMGARAMDSLAIIEWEGNVQGVPGGGPHRARAVVVNVGTAAAPDWRFTSLVVSPRS